MVVIRKEEAIISLFKSIVFLKRFLKKARLILETRRIRPIQLKSKKKLFSAVGGYGSIVPTLNIGNATVAEPNDDETTLNTSRSKIVSRNAYKVNKSFARKLDDALTNSIYIPSSSINDIPDNNKHDFKIDSIIMKNERIGSQGGAHEGTNTVEFMSGREINYGSSVTLQAGHGGLLSFEREDVIRTSAPSALPHARFTILNANNILDAGVIRYGDSITLQAGEFEILGAKYHIDDRGDALPYLTLITCRGHQLDKAIAFGKWIILSRTSTVRSIGSLVGHCDTILLEKDWYFLSSNSPQIAELSKTGSFETAEHSIAQPRYDCSWRLRLVSLPVYNDTVALKNVNRGLLSAANTQMDRSCDRRVKAIVFLNRATDHFDATKASEYAEVERIRTPVYKERRKLAIEDKLRQYELSERPKTPPIEFDTSPQRTATESAEEVYKEHRLPLLISSKEWGTMTNKLLAYYDVRPWKKFQAAMLIQSWMVKYVRKFSYTHLIAEQKRLLEIKVAQQLETEKKAVNVPVSRVNTREQRRGTMSRNVALSLSHSFVQMKPISNAVESHLLYRDERLRPEDDLKAQKITNDVHWSRRRKINVFDTPVKCTLKVREIQSDSRNICNSLKFLKSTKHTTPRLYDDLSLIKIGK